MPVLGSAFPPTSAMEAKAIQLGEPVDDFSDITTWVLSTGSVAATLTNPTDTTYGNALQIASPNGTARVQRPFCGSLVNRFISFKIKTTAGSAHTGLVLVVGGTTYTVRFDQTLGIDDTLTGTGSAWREITVAPSKLSAQGGALDSQLNDVRAIGFYVVTQGGLAATVQIANLRVHDSPLAPGIVWTFDDARLSQYTNAYPILSAAGFTGNAYCAPQLLGTTISDSGQNYPAMSLANLQAMKAAGWTVGCHGYTHTRLTTLSLSQQQTEFDNAYNYLLANGLTNTGGTHIAYPFGAFDANTLALARSYFRSGRTAGTDDASVTPYLDDRYRLQPFGAAASQAASYYTAAMDKVKNRGGVLLLIFHEVAAGSTTDPLGYPNAATFQTVVNYAVSLGLPSYSLDQLYPAATPGVAISATA